MCCFVVCCIEREPDIWLFYSGKEAAENDMEEQRKPNLYESKTYFVSPNKHTEIYLLGRKEV